MIFLIFSFNLYDGVTRPSCKEVAEPWSWDIRDIILYYALGDKIEIRKYFIDSLKICFPFVSITITYHNQLKSESHHSCLIYLLTFAYDP